MAGINLGALAGGFTEHAGELLLGFGVGTALSEALHPEAVEIGQASWRLNPVKVVDPLTAAAVVAEDVRKREWGANEALSSGVDGARFDAIVGEVLNAPGIGELLRMWRRDTISDAEFVHGLRKAKLEVLWDKGLGELRDERLDPAVIATSIQRGIIADPGLLPVGPPSATGRVPPMPVAHVDALKEAAAGGFNRERLAAITRIVGLPPAPGELLQLVNRGLIDDVDFHRGVAEGNTRNEWGSFLLELRRRLLTPHEYAELRLRGWIDTPAMRAGAALSGMDTADTDLLFRLLGRPIIARQVVTGEARGGSYDGPTAGIPQPFLRSLEQSNIRPEWYNLAYANRYTLPSAFVMRRLLQDGALTAGEAETVFLQSGWRPDLAKLTAHAYGKAPTTKSGHLTNAELLAEYEGLYVDRATLLVDLEARGFAPAEAEQFASIADARRVKASRDARLRRIKAQYVNHKIHLDEATAALDATEIPAAAQTLLLEQWEPEREVNVAKLTAPQVKRAYRKGIYTRDVALAELEDRGYSPADAATFLDS